MSRLIEDRADVIGFLNKVFSNAVFDSFHFDMFFTIRFRLEHDFMYEGFKIQEGFSICVESSILLNSLEYWNEYVKCFPEHESVEREEPIIAFVLGSIRWSNNYTIEKFTFRKSQLELTFSEDKTLCITNDVQEGIAWSIEGQIERDENWLVTMDNNEVFLRLP